MHEIWLIDDDRSVRFVLAEALREAGYMVRDFDNARAALSVLPHAQPAAVFTDVRMPDLDGFGFLEALQQLGVKVPVIVISAYTDVASTSAAFRGGAFDFLPKPFDLNQAVRLAARAIESEGRTTSVLAPVAIARQGLLGESAPMRELFRAIGRVAPTDLNVLITGETGTGKELVARALHFDGPRGRAPFVELNCSSIPANMLEAELFGYERGAFTDAKERKLGLIEVAEGGTLFLDEVGEMDLALQAKLLKFLEDKTVRRLGSVREQRANARVIAATHRNLDEMVREGTFRSDLLFRLRIVQIKLPTLRSMPDDIPLLAAHYLQRQAARYGKNDLRFSDEALAMLARHTWPGNVRELRNVIEHSVILCSGAQITPEHLHLGPGHNGDIAADPAPGLNLGDAERKLLVQALEQTDWNVTRAARLLGVTRDVLRYRIDKYRLRMPT